MLFQAMKERIQVKIKLLMILTLKDFQENIKITQNANSIFFMVQSYLYNVKMIFEQWIYPFLAKSMGNKMVK